MTIPNNIIPNNLKAYRQQKDGLTQVKLAKSVGISETHLQSIEYGKTAPNVYLSQRLALKLGVTVEDLFPLPGEVSATDH